MDSTLEILTKDLQELQQERIQAIETVQMYNGAIQYVERKIQELTPKNEPVKNKPDKK
jgi:hypothetical protein